MNLLKKSFPLFLFGFLVAGFFIFTSFSLPEAKAKKLNKPQTAPMSEKFQRYLDLKKAGKLKMEDSEKHPLGLIPSPVETGKASKEEISRLAKLSINRQGFPSSYDLRSLGKVSSVKDQGNCGSCWAFATMAALESNWLVTGESESNLSENNLKECHGFEWAACDGGNGELSSAYLSQNNGPISETNDPYSDSEESCQSNLTPMAYMPNAIYLPNNTDVIKQYLSDYGALYTSMRWETASFNSGNNTYYYGGSGDGNHAIALVGWDDSKPTAGGTGAWIIKNSWDDDWGENGFFYISYNDTRVNEEVVAWISKLSYNETKTIYMYDEMGMIDNTGWNNGTDYGLTKFIAEDNQKINKVGAWMTSDVGTVSFEIYDDFNGTTLSNLLGSLSSQSVNYAGYYTFDLPSAVPIENGDDFYVKASFTTPGYNNPIPIERFYDEYADPTIETGKNWFSDTGNNNDWEAIGTGTSHEYDLGIRVYATDIVANLAISPAGGNYASDQSVSLATTTSGATIYYTTDGSTPTTDSNVYSSPISITRNTTLKAIAIKSGMNDSGVMSETYTINVNTPTASPGGGTYTADQSVTLASGTSGATIYYTTDGGTPTTGSNVYSSPISITRNTTLKAIAMKSGMNDSGVISETYTINVTTDTPTVDYSTNKKIRKRVHYTFKNTTLTQKKYVSVRIGGKKVKILRLGRSGNDSIVLVELKYGRWGQGNYTLTMNYKNKVRVAYRTKKGKTKYRYTWDRGSATQENALTIQ